VSAQLSSHTWPPPSTTYLTSLVFFTKDCGNEQHALKISPLETPARKVVKVSDTDENDDGLKFLRPTFRARKLQECFHPPKTMTLKECVLSPSTERCNVSPTFSPTLRIL
jgi:hypothetical protein